jgi:hypothetical protein
MLLGTRAPALVLAAGLGLLAGCRDDSLEHLDFELPVLSFTLTDGSLRASPPGDLPNLVCAGPLALVTDCCTPPAPAVAIDCQQYPVTCDPLVKLCALTFDVEPVVDMNLVVNVAAVAAVDGRVFSSVSLVSLSATVELSGSLPIRSANLYVGPKGFGTSSSPAARLVTSVPLATGTAALVPAREAQQAFSDFACDYRTPFSWLLAAHVVILPGPRPSGSAIFEVAARAKAEY